MGIKRVNVDKNRIYTHGIKMTMHYPSVFKPAPVKNPGDEPKYQVAFAVRKDDKELIEAMRAAHAEAVRMGAAGYNKMRFTETEAKYFNFDAWLEDHDADKPRKDGPPIGEKSPEFAGTYKINARSKRKPGVYASVNGAIKPISEFDEDEIYGGAECDFDIAFYPFAGSAKGIALGLQNICKTGAGERFGGSVAPAFEPVGEAPLV